jgi:prevent-host-death family protein
MSLPTTISVGAFDARTRFFELLERIEAGEEVTIVRHGVPVARLVPPTKAVKPTAVKPAKERAASVPTPSLSIARGLAELALS